MNNIPQQHQIDIMDRESLIDDRETLLFNAKMENNRLIRELKRIDFEIQYYDDVIAAFHNIL